LVSLPSLDGGPARSVGIELLCFFVRAGGIAKARLWLLHLDKEVWFLIDFIIERFQGGSQDGIDTSQSKYYVNGFNKALLKTKEMEGDIIDPFARNCKWGTIRNDMDQTIKTVHYNLESLDFMKLMKSNSAKIVLFDPPFSDRQAKKYELGDTNLYCTGDGRIGKLCREIERVLKPGGVMVKLGYNSSRPTKNFDLLHLMVINFGGTRNDVILSIWIKNTTTLDSFIVKASRP